MAIRKDDIFLFTPLLILAELEEPNDIPAMLKSWKCKFLTGWNAEVWRKLEIDQEPNIIRKSIGFFRIILKWFWPSIIMSFIAYFSVWSGIFLAVILLPLQIIMVIFLILKLYLFICIAAAYRLDHLDINDNEN